MLSGPRISSFICLANALLWLLSGLRNTHGLTIYGWNCRSPDRVPCVLRLQWTYLGVSTNDVDTVTSDKHVDTNPRVIPAACIPRELDKMALFESRNCDERPTSSESSGNGRQRTVTRVSIDPPVFILRNAITSEECFHIRSVALSMETQMEDGKTVGDEGDVNPKADSEPVSGKERDRDQPRKNSRVGWLENDRPSIEAIARRAHGVFLNGTMPFHATRGIEPLQVIHYHGEGGEYVNHHDGNNRILTVLYYLNGVGATWFPLAGNGGTTMNEGSQDGSRQIRNLAETRIACIGKSPGRNGVLITCRDQGDECETTEMESIVARVNGGDAVAFYNYRVDGSVNWNAFHSGLPVTEEELIMSKDDENKNTGGKWIANHFYHFVPSHIPETPPPKSADAASTRGKF